MARVVRFLRRLLLLTISAGGLFAASQTPFVRAPLPGRDGPALANVTSWGYQLQNARPDRIASAIDLLVIDGQRNAFPPRPLSAGEVGRFRTRPDGTQRTVLAYLSIGEAENYRPYWWRHWSVFKPAWLGPENREWKGNFRVRFWDPGWRRLMVNTAPSLLERGIDLVWPASKPALDHIIEAGFDGVYLDRVDAFYDWRKSRPDAEAAMLAFVAEISDYAKRRRPGFLVVPQNAEELLRHSAYRRKIDAIAKEDLLFGADHNGDPNPSDTIAESVRYLNLARGDRLPVLAVEYLADGDKRRQALARMRGLGFITVFADRALKTPPELTDSIVPPAPLPATPLPVRPKG